MIYPEWHFNYVPPYDPTDKDTIRKFRKWARKKTDRSDHMAIIAKAYELFGEAAHQELERYEKDKLKGATPNEQFIFSSIQRKLKFISRYHFKDYHSASILRSNVQKYNIYTFSLENMFLRRWNLLKFIADIKVLISIARRHYDTTGINLQNYAVLFALLPQDLRPQFVEISELNHEEFDAMAFQVFTECRQEIDEITIPGNYMPIGYIYVAQFHWFLQKELEKFGFKLKVKSILPPPELEEEEFLWLE